MARVVDTGLLEVAGPAAPPRSNGELVFSEPWESRAFGLAVTLHAGGAFEWENFRQELIATVGRWEGDHPEAEGWSYYACWLEALERVLAAEGLVARDDVEDRARQLAGRPSGHGHRHDDHDH
ncbi:MAG: nitrile hydratase accessory protein [Actinomycetota bacterium]|nr:nitrile hydratase accessory protein [Actinomycetota bacterium]